MQMDKFIALAKAAVTVVALGGTAVAVLGYDLRLADSASIASFLGFAAFALLDYLADRDVLLAFYRALKFLVLFLIAVSLGVAVQSLFSFSGVMEAHADSQVRTAVAARLLQIKVGFFSLFAGFILTGLYAIWKFKATRFAESRLGLLKDLLFQVNSIVSDATISPSEQRRQAIQCCLSTLLAALELSPWQWLLRRLSIMKRSFCACAVELLEPDLSSQHYRIVSAAYPKDVPASAQRVFTWIEQNYFPTFLREERFNELVSLAKGANSKGWKSRFFNFPNRHTIVSAVGWIGHKRVTLLSHDAFQCRAFDSSFFDLATKQNFAKQDLSWAKIRSFIGCPIGVESEGPSKVLFVTKRIPHGFVAEDREVVIAVSQIINSALAATSGGS